MSLSAAKLGKLIGLTAEEVNTLLKDQGFLEGTPNNYSLTDTGKEYGEEKIVRQYPASNARSRYNPSWNLRSFKESILDSLDITEEKKSAIRTEVQNRHKNRYTEDPPLKPTIASSNKTPANAIKASQNNGLPRISVDYKYTGITITATALLGIGTYGIYKMSPKIKQWWINKKDKKVLDEDIRTQSESVIKD